MADEAGRRWEGAFPPDLGAPKQARLGVDRLLEGAGVPSATAEVARVVLSELVANAIRHARTEFNVSAHICGDVVRIEVLDRDTRPPALMGLDDDSTSGRGLHIVAGLSRDWGWQTADAADGVSGKVVWAEVALDQPADAERP